jgi:hypothetical protein
LAQIQQGLVDYKTKELFPPSIDVDDRLKVTTRPEGGRSGGDGEILAPFFTLRKAIGEYAILKFVAQKADKFSICL